MDWYDYKKKKLARELHICFLLMTPTFINIVTIAIINPVDSQFVVEDPNIMHVLQKKHFSKIS